MVSIAHKTAAAGWSGHRRRPRSGRPDEACRGNRGADATPAVSGIGL